MSAAVLPEWMEGDSGDHRTCIQPDGFRQGPSREPSSILFLAKVLHRAIRILRSDLDKGIEPYLLVAQSENTTNSLNRILKTLSDVADSIPQQFRGPIARKLLARIRRIESEVVKLQAHLEKYLQAAKTPLPPLDMDSIRRGRADVAAGRVEDSHDICQRIRLGGDL